MKAFIALLVCAWAALALARPDVNLDEVERSKEEIKKAHEKCQSDPKTAVNEDELKGILKGGAPPANLEAHALCVSKAVGWQNEDGSVNKELINSRAVAIFGERADLKKVIDECTASKGTEEDTAVHIFKCFKRHAPQPPELPPLPGH